MTSPHTFSPTAKAWIITGPTSGIGYRTAFELAKHGIVVLVGRSRAKLDGVEREIRESGGHAVSVVADLSDITSVRAAAAQIVALKLPIAGLLNNAGIFPNRPSMSPQGWDNAFATNHLGPFALTEALIPHLPDGASILFVASAVEDPGRTIAVRAGFRGSRHIAVEASSRGEWLRPGGSTRPGYDAYATSKQGALISALSLAREFPRLRINAIEPGVNPGSNLSRDSGPAVVAVAKVLSPVLALMPYFTTPKRAAKVIAAAMTSTSKQTGVYFDENGRPMRGSKQAHDEQFQDQYIADTRALLATVS